MIGKKRSACNTQWFYAVPVAAWEITRVRVPKFFPFFSIPSRPGRTVRSVYSIQFRNPIFNPYPSLGLGLPPTSLSDPSPLPLTLFLLPYPTRLLRCPAPRTNAGNSKSASSTSSPSSITLGPGLPATKLSSATLSTSPSGLGTDTIEWRLRSELERMRLRVCGVIVWPAVGDAVIVVPGLACGGGVGEEERNRGCMYSSIGE